MTLPKLAIPVFKTAPMPISNKVVEFRPYTVKEDKILLMAAQDANIDLSSVALATRQVINSCVTSEDNFDVSNLAAIDADFLLLNIRSKSVGETIEIGMTCNHINEEDQKTCTNEMKVSINITDLKLYDPDKENRVDLVDIGNNISIKLKPTTFRATIQGASLNNEIDRNINILFNSIDKIINGDEILTTKDFTAEEFKSWIEQIEPKKFFKLVEYIDKLPTIRIEKNEKCNKCGHDHEFRFDDTMNFF